MESIQISTFFVVKVIILLIGLAIILTILGQYISYDRIAIANAQELASAIDQACQQPGREIPVDFSLQQNKIFAGPLAPKLLQYPIRTHGDPNFVLYYESFPPGEGIGWEIYHNFQYRALVQLPASLEGKPAEGTEVRNFLKDYYRDFALKNPDKLLDAIVVTNVVHSHEYSGIYTIEEGDVGIIDEDEKFPLLPGAEEIFSFGNWTEDATLQQKDFFRFSNYAGMSRLSKTLIKYQSCGPDSVCLKTREGVYRFPVGYCKSEGIKGVQLVYDARNRKEVWGALGLLVVPFGTVLKFAKVAKVVSWTKRALKLVKNFWKYSPKTIVVGGAIYTGDQFMLLMQGTFISFKSGDLALSSPCEIEKMTIVVKECDDRADIPWSWDYKICTSKIEYPLYAVQNGKFQQVGTHTYCADKIPKTADERNEVEGSIAESWESDDMCVRIQVYDIPEDYCWTEDPSTNFRERGGVGGKFDWLANIDSEVWTRIVGSVGSITPVRDSTQFVSDPKVITLLPSDIEEFAGSSKLKAFFSATNRAELWGWPGR